MNPIDTHSQAQVDEKERSLTRSDFEQLPRHVAVIMDGNGRWAKAQGKPRIFGHQFGADKARKITLECNRLGIEALTLFSFSTENWKRPKEEVDFLMQLGQMQLKQHRETLNKYNIRFRHVGSHHGLPDSILNELNEIEELTADNSGLTVALALNYGARSEITEAVQTIARKVASGDLKDHQISEEVIGEHLFTAGLPDPDLLIRTAGEMRISNFLLWQISYAEIYVTQTYWPDFDVRALHDAFREFGRRQRRFGDVEAK